MRACVCTLIVLAKSHHCNKIPSPSNIQWYANSSPGQATTLQLSVLLLEPTQSAPPPCGVGSVQVRVRVREPAPQVTVQVLQDVHWAQPPSTVTHIKHGSTCEILSHTNLLFQ